MVELGVGRRKLVKAIPIKFRIIMVERVYWLATLLAGNNIGAGGRNRTGTPIQEQDFKQGFGACTKSHD